MANKDFYDTFALTGRQIDFVSNLFDAKSYKIPEEYNRRINNMNFDKLNVFSSNQITPKKIIYSGNKTIVIWEDGVKTIVSLAEGDQYDPYLAFCAALAKKVYGSTSAAKRIVNKKSSTNNKPKYKNNIIQIPINAKMKPDELSKKIREIIGALNKNWRVNENE